MGGVLGRVDGDASSWGGFNAMHRWRRGPRRFCHGVLERVEGGGIRDESLVLMEWRAPLDRYSLSSTASNDELYA